MSDMKDLESFQTKLVSESKEADAETCFQEPDKNRELKKLFDRLWEAADELRANSKLRSAQYSTPVLGILFLRYAYHKFEEATKELEKKHSGRDHPLRKLDYQAEGAIYLTEKARFKYLLDLPEGASIGKAIDDAMRSIEDENEELRDVLPKVYTNMEDSVLINLLKIFHKIPTKLDRDIFGKIYEYFLGKFAMSEGQRGGEFYTPTSIVRLIVEIVEPYHGRILDPACGSGGMFVQSAEFVKDHLKNPYKEISIYGQEKADDTVRLCKMNLAIHGLSGDIRQGNSYYEDVFNKLEQFDYVMANPPFNVNNVDREAIKDDLRYPFGLPTVDNANYLWIQVFYSMLNENGRAGFVMANSASDARHSELDIRKKLIMDGVVDVIISVASNFFYTVTLPVTLWFLNRGKKGTAEKDKVLFIDARKFFRQIDRAHREFTLQQLEFISNIVRLYRGQQIERTRCSSQIIEEHFPELRYRDVRGLCKVATIDDIRDQGWSLNPGRYVGIEELEAEDLASLERYNEELQKLNLEARELEEKINENIEKVLSQVQLPGRNEPRKDWKKLKVDELKADVPNAIAMGPFGSRIRTENFVSHGVPVIRGINISKGRFYPKDFVYLTEEKANELRSSNAFPEDLVFTHRGTLGQVGIIPEGEFPRYVVSQSQMKLTCNKKIVVPQFLFYYFSSIGKHELLKHKSGSGVPALASPSTSLKNIIIDLPPIHEQEKIAAILSNIDDIIENNVLRIEILERIAQSLYNEWFVKLKYPGHENAEIAKTSDGSMPKEWRVKNLGDICTITMGQSPSSKYYNEDGKGLPFHQGVSDFGEIFPVTKRYSSKGNRIAERGDILFSVRAPVGRINFANTEMILGRGLCGIRSKTGDWMFLYEQLKRIFHEEDIMGGGTIFKAVTKKDMHGIKVICPNQALVDEFEALARPIFRQIEILSTMNQTLGRLKDLVLPKLISGEIDVNTLDINALSD